MSSLRFSHKLFKAAHGAITALACAMIAFVASAQPSDGFDKQRLRWLSKFPTDAAIPLVFGQSSNESFWIVDPTELFSRRLLNELFRDGPQKLTGKVYIYLRPLQTTDERANQMTAYIWCSRNRAERLKEVLSDDFSLPSKPNESCDTRAIQKILRNTSDLNSIPIGLHAQGIVRGAIPVTRLAEIERGSNIASVTPPSQVISAVSPVPIPTKNLTHTCPPSFDIQQDGFLYRYEYRHDGTILGRDLIGDPRGLGPHRVAMSVEHAVKVFERVRPDDIPMNSREAGLRWIQCVTRKYKSGAERVPNVGSAASVRGSIAEQDIDTVTPQVPGCPKYLRKSLVTWRQVGNPQLNTWEIRNVSGKTLTVTYLDDGVNGETNGLGPGSTNSVSLVSRVIPPYVVRDFDELFAFNKTPAARAGKTLKCQLAIRPR